jgi:hypothetical protein
MLFGGQNAHFNQIFTINKENYLFYFGKGHKILHITFFSLSITHFANKQNPSKLDENNRVQILKFPSNLQYGPICVKITIVG